MIYDEIKKKQSGHGTRCLDQTVAPPASDATARWIYIVSNMSSGTTDFFLLPVLGCYT